MIRNLKVLLAAALCLCSLGAVASASQAAEFTAPGAGAAETELKLLPDGTGKTAHWVFDISAISGSPSISTTCSQIGGTLHSVPSVATSVTLTKPSFGGTCTDSTGQTATVTNHGCHFTFTASGLLHIISDAGKECKHGKQPITIVTPTCTVEIGEQTINGIKYHNVGTTVTVEAINLTNIKYNAKGSSCDFGTTENGVYTTGTAIVEGRRSGAEVEIKWDA